MVIALLVSRRRHAQRMHVQIQQGFLFLAFAGVLFAQSHDLAQDLDVEAGPLRFAVNIFYVVGDRLLFFLEAFRPLR